MKPLRDYVLIRQDEMKKTDAGIWIPDSKKGELRTGTVLDIGPDISPQDENINVGSKVVYIKHGDLQDEVGSEGLIHISKIIGTDKEISPIRNESNPYDIKWNDFVTEEHSVTWKDWTNIRSFEFRIIFLKPFINICSLQKEAYDIIVKDILEPFLESTTTLLHSSNIEDDELSYIVVDDKFGGRISIDENQVSFRFERDDLQYILQKLPAYMAAIDSISSSSKFYKIFGKGFNRVKMTSLRIEQVYNIIGKTIDGKRPVTNKEFMKELMKLGTAASDSDSESVVDALSPRASTIGRADFKVSFEREIAKHDYMVWLAMQAPTNQDSSSLWVNIEIQDNKPGVFSERNYAPLFTDFFRDSYYESFLNQLFQGYYCKTIGG